jgi:AcrR family transcriptional regulator
MLDAADRIVGQEGADALTTTRVAEAAGVSVGSLYQYLPDKDAIIGALANRYLAEFEGLMERLVEEARAGSPDWDDPVETLIDAFARRYRERPGYRALWFGRDLSEELLTADRLNKAILGRGVREILLALGLVRDDDDLELAARTGVLVADSLLQEAFRVDPYGDPQLIEEGKRILRLYLADVREAGRTRPATGARRRAAGPARRRRTRQ